MEELQDNNAKEPDEVECKQSKGNLGRLQYKINYDFHSYSLAVTVVKAEELPALNMDGTSNPYVKVYLLPDKRKTFKTKVHRKTLNPSFNNTFTFKSLSYGTALNQTLVLAIFNSHRFSKDDQIGKIQVPLIHETSFCSQKIIIWRELQSFESNGGSSK